MSNPLQLFIDIETVPGYEDPEENPELFSCFKSKLKWEFKDKEMSLSDWKQVFKDRAGLFAEYGKIVCISMGYVNKDEQIVLKSFTNENEKELLQATADAMWKAETLIAHNGKEFDFPWLCRRMLIHGVDHPKVLKIQNLKPWQVKLEDTQEMWRFGQFNYKVSLVCLCTLFGLPSPKDDMDGSQVAHVYYKEKNLLKIAHYCEGDVRSMINVYRKLKNQEPILAA
jgi:predicted PolB exonuclease-like 3'-5' exonuclease